MTTTTTVTETHRQLAAMFTENTGRHMLDSGGAYGRNWERNQGRGVESFMAEPEAYFTSWGGDDWGVLLSTFQFLADRLEYDADLNAEFDALAEANPDDHWFALAEKFPAHHANLHDLEVPEDGTGMLTVNTYNHENALDQVIQYIQVSHDGDGIYPDYVILQVHGGCDVRGGYTAPKIFTVAGWGEVGLLDDNRCGVSCEGVDPYPHDTLPGFDKPVKVYHSWYSDDGGSNWYGNDGEGELERKVNDDGEPICSECGATLIASPY